MLKWLLWLVILPLLLLAAYVWFVLNWSYSTGERAGYVQKLSKRGIVCKTWEGELALVTMPGTVAEKFFFTVWDDAIAEKINQSIGQRVALEYDQHIGIPTNCFGESQYFVKGVRVVSEPAIPASPLEPQRGAPQPQNTPQTQGAPQPQPAAPANATPAPGGTGAAPPESTVPAPASPTQAPTESK